jgi:hypothetical protein
MSDKDDPSIWWLRVRALPDDVPGPVRMRRMLKLMLRSYGLRVEQVSGEGPSETPQDHNEPS